MRKLLLLIIHVFLVASYSFGQLTVTTGAAVTAPVLVSTLLDPSIVLVGTPVLNCGTNAKGTFTSGGAQAGKIGGITTGIILSTGLVSSIAANNTGTVISGTGGSGVQDDPDLKALTGKNNQDVCRLIFSIQVDFDSLAISYVFGTEEFPAYCPPTDNSGTYNDVFGFFISGPGITGNKNIALIPGTTTSVSSININNVNNPTYFVDNSGSGNPIAFNGLTKLLTAKIKVIPGSTYQIKLAIADVGSGLTGRDMAYDSGIFIKGASIKAVAVPVELLSFNTEKVGSASKITWSTATEKNNDYFELQRSTDGMTYTPIYTAKGAGNSNSIVSYSYVDEKPVNGSDNYYRLLQVDFDGKKKLSKVLSLNFAEKIKTLSISPNPVGNKFTAQVNLPESGIATVEILDIAGRIILSKEIELNQGINSVDMDTEELLTGTYFFRVRSENYTGEVQRIVK